MSQFITRENLFINTRELAKVLCESNGYEEFDKNIVENKIEFDPQKTYAIAESNFFDFNQDAYEDINHMNSISSGLYCERCLVTYRIFIWSSRGEGYEIFKHVLRKEEIQLIQSEEFLKEYILVHLEELEKVIVDTYKMDTKQSFEEFGKAIESKQLPLKNILQYISVDNNIKDF